MNKLNLEAVDMVAAAINPAEAAADMAALEASRTLEAILAARQHANLPMGIAIRPMQKVAEAINHSLEARRRLVEAHAMLEQTAADLGIKMDSYGKDYPPQAVEQGAPVAERPDA